MKKLMGGSEVPSVCIYSSEACAAAQCGYYDALERHTITDQDRHTRESALWLPVHLGKIDELAINHYALHTSLAAIRGVHSPGNRRIDRKSMLCVISSVQPRIVQPI